MALHPNKGSTNGDQGGAWRREIWAGPEEASAGDLRCSRGLTPCARARILQKNRISRRYRLGEGVGCGERERATFKELAYKLMEVGQGGWRPREDLML